MLSVSSIPALNDNYIWLIKNDDNHCVVVDPGDATPVFAFLENHGLILDAILITHHHDDHVGGVPELTSHYPNTSVYGPATARFPQVTHPLKDKSTFTLFGSEFVVREVPGHTLDHIVYYSEDMLFCGDTLFSGGCGRLFEGSPAQMHKSLSLLSSLPDDTLVFCAHEYTQSNLKFAQAVEPSNTALKDYSLSVDVLRSNNKITLPSTIGKEKNINPFLRVDQASIKSAVQHRATDSSETETFAALRRWKDEF
ncbi:hydroxyacylglutathione hydrolase [Enterovibrio norvegicus FF-33]|uniref:hydroxyacylglutathione hydrolase n=1 Tax=Enterovibrio norvegicus TaxID=188144 RepID=UPI0002F5089C|nr:hydroxyacylglutathione hydrolase [Enterovibrio norvegicus]OEE68265.1 hydroxyacylglutathione hydrolase [Enterovibrio norvegicus FF-33]